MRTTRSFPVELDEGIFPRVRRGNRHVRNLRRKRHLFGLVARWTLRAALVWGVLVAGARCWRFTTTSPALAVSNVEFSGARYVSQATLDAMAATLTGSNLLTIDLEAVQRQWSNRGWIRTLYLRRSPPSTVVVRIVERRPVAVLAARGGRFFVGGDGVIIDSYSEGTCELALPTVTVSEARREGLALALDFIKQASARPAFLNRVRGIEALTSEQIAIDLEDAPYRILVGSGGYIEKIDRYCLVEPLLGKAPEAPEVVNLAYRNQVVLSPVR